MWELTLDRVLNAEWRVERPHPETGRMQRVIFAGPDAEGLARDYHQLMNRRDATEAARRAPKAT